jgi:hypothetical protein
MNVKNIILAGLVAVAAALTPMAMAADIGFPTPVDQRPTVVQFVNNFDGAYIGVGATTSWNSNEYTPVLSVGVNNRYDAVVVGAEVFGTFDIENNGLNFVETVGIDAKAGFVVTENVAVYALAGVEINTNTAIARNAVGGGVDFAVNEGLVLAGTYKQVTDFGSFNNADHRVTIGAKFPF